MARHLSFVRGHSSGPSGELHRDMAQMKPKNMQGLTTGETSRALGISILTVERLFDKGILTGWKHPITGWRAVDPKSVKALKRRGERGRGSKTHNGKPKTM